MGFQYFSNFRRICIGRLSWNRQPFFHLTNNNDFFGRYDFTECKYTDREFFFTLDINKFY
jgi:hypothetical protein